MKILRERSRLCLDSSDSFAVLRFLGKRNDVWFAQLRSIAIVVPCVEVFLCSTKDSFRRVDAVEIDYRRNLTSLSRSLPQLKALNTVVTSGDRFRFRNLRNCCSSR